MVEEGPYEILPYAEIETLKRQIEDLKKSSSSSEILNAINRLTSIMESMLHLFESAATGMKKEDEGHLSRKLDKLIEQNETIAESILSLVDMVKELQSKEKEPPYIARENPQQFASMPQEPMPEPFPRIESGPDFSMPPNFDRLRMPAAMQRQSQSSVTPPAPTMSRREPAREGPMPMPTGSFKDLNFEKPRKGLFGKLRK